MPKKKVDLAYIAKDSTRRSSYKKRKKGLTKKVSELATLCNVSACMILYGPQEGQLEVWPSEAEAARVVARLRRMSPVEQCRSMMNQEDYLRQRAAKLHDQLRRQQRDNRELEASLLMHELLAGGGRSLLDVGIEDARSLALMADAKLKEVRERTRCKRAELATTKEEETKNNPLQVVVKEEGKDRLQVAMEPVTVKEEVNNPWQTAVECPQRQNWLEDVKNPNENNGVLFAGTVEEVMSMSYDEYKYNYSGWLENNYFPIN
ncbi:agamous-like MADS-box protein [Canna indica]|uniref:Agamous-like MADS-box protein n=1 Tax=Canna indica TaxID=4628 RepID=A0AAQ3KJA2_9LILI|nr:agamous-like MADS-box protein [Canna indica]